MSIRTERVAEEIRHQIADVLKKELSELHIGLVTVTRVRVSPDLKQAKIYLSFIGNKVPAETCIEKINLRKKQIRMGLSHKIHLRFMPELSFYYDDTIEYANHIDELIKQIHKDNGKK
ncbi:MAG TPA: 30S ribosome-binding factor RbfA [Ignavibacteria bacterium]|jgi:ribosome-binding factor A